MSGFTAKAGLLNLMGDLKARIHEKIGFGDLPVPQFVMVGKQGVGKNRLIETLAGEPFRFATGAMGARRIVLFEFRNVASAKSSRWFVRLKGLQWEEHTMDGAMKAVGQQSEDVGDAVNDQPVHVRVESACCLDLQIVDVPSFRDSKPDASTQRLSRQVDDLALSLMRDRRCILICVEDDANVANMTTFHKCRNLDPRFERTVLVRNKLDKYYGELKNENIDGWFEGFGDLPDHLNKFALSLPVWQDGTPSAKQFKEMCEEAVTEDARQLGLRGLSENHLENIGFRNFADFLQKRMEMAFMSAIVPVMTSLKSLRVHAEKEAKALSADVQATDPHRIISTTRDCGVSFAMALTHVMEGALNLDPVATLEDELKCFHQHHENIGTTNMSLLPSDDFADLPEYIDYLRNEIQMSTFDVEVNGGAQFRRLMLEVEIFLRFSEINVDAKKRDVIQARGVSVNTLTWRDVVVKLLNAEAHLPLQKRVIYVGERIKHFFMSQKEAVLAFMNKLEGTPASRQYSPMFPKHAKVISQNPSIKQLLFSTYDKACDRQLRQFLDLFENMLSSTFSNPWVFLKGIPGTGDETADALPGFEETKQRIPKEIHGRSGSERALAQWLHDIPNDPCEIDEAVDKVQALVLKTYSYIRSQVCDQVELFAETFFKLPMMRRLEADMADIELAEEDLQAYQSRRDRLAVDFKKAQEALAEVDGCVNRLQSFKTRCEARGINLG